MNVLRTLTVALTLAALSLPHRAAAADNALDEAKALYANASYEAALKALEAVDASAPDAEEYRILCLLALGRTDDAQHAIEGLVVREPTLVPGDEEFPPRFVSLYMETRQRVLPTLIMDTFAAGREQYRAAKRAEATAQFEKVLALSADPAIAKMADIADARTLASGFLDLLKASDPSAATGLRQVPAGGNANAAPTAAPTSTQPPATSTMTQAVPIRQNLPRWVAPDRIAASSTLQGALRVVIGTDGKVKSATIEASVHPAYDGLLLNATREWRYTPAMLNGKPVESDRLIRVQITP